VTGVNDIKIHKLNESYSAIEAPKELINQMFEFLKVERPGAFFEPLVKNGFKSPYDFFGSIQNEQLLVMNGHLDLFKSFGVVQEQVQPEFTEAEVDEFLVQIKKGLPFAPYDFQEIAFKESILNYKQINRMCTSSGKSMTISLIAEFFRRKGRKGLLLVPNINLLSQFKKDIGDYNLTDLYEDSHVIGGGSTERHFNNSLTISTWQSLLNYKEDLGELDYIITDESHRFASLETSAIVKETLNCKYKFGFTGTLPEDPVMKMELFGLFGLPKTYITGAQLIERGLGTPIKINTIVFKYSDEDKKLFKNIQAPGRSKNKYPAQLQFIKDHEARNEFIVSLLVRLRNTGNTLMLYQHTLHGKGLFIDTMARLYPDVEVLNKNITGKKSFEFQKQYGVYFLNGEDDAKTRENTRQVLEEHNDAILIANFAILSTGVNIKKLHNLVLASSMKSYTTVTQSIGRGMRLHETKSVFTVFDLTDDFGIRKAGGIFYKQYIHRRNTSYNPEQYPVTEVDYKLF
jgi:superfamily II DNA or RNA helicase